MNPSRSRAGSRLSPTLATLALVALAVTAAPSTTLAQSRAPDHMVVRSDKVMGTRVTVSIWSDDEKAAAAAIAAVLDEFRRIDRLMTTWHKDSEVSRVNAAAGSSAVQVSDEVLMVIDKALEVSRQTSGAFDVTVGAFRGLWKFDQDKDGSIPTRDEVKSRMALIGYKGVAIERARKRVRLARKGMRLTLGGIAKGYAVDRAVALLYDRNFVDFIIQAGGDLYVSGRRGDRNWRVGIRDPRGSRESTFAIAAIENRTFSTSGDYERYLVKDGVRYHHILDPKTGQPARRSRSVTVMAKDAFTADAWSTALFVIGVEKGMPMVEQMPGLEAVFVDAANKVHMSSGLEGKVWVHKQPSPGL